MKTAPMKQKRHRAVPFPGMPAIFTVVDRRTAKILGRDLLFLVLVAVALMLVSYVETNAPDAVSTLLPSKFLVTFCTWLISC